MSASLGVSALIIDRGVQREVDAQDTEELSVQIRAALPADELFDAVVAAIERFETDWDQDQPVKTASGADAPPPEIVATPTPPEVVVSFLKLVDPPVSFSRFVAALESVLPGDARVRKPRTRSLPWNVRELAYLELRLALIGESGPSFFGWKVDAQAQTSVDHIVIAWLRSFGGKSPLYLTPAAAPEVVVPPGRELENLTAQLERAGFATLSAADGNQFRTARYWFETGHVSLVVGATEPPGLDWERARAVLIDLLRNLEPFTQSAILRRDDNLGLAGPAAHAGRNLWRVPNRKSLNVGRERMLEERGLVDAQGEFFLSYSPPSLPSEWTQRPLGHLTQVTAPNIEDWLSQTPTEDTIVAGRRALAALLSEWVGPDQLKKT